MIQAAKTMWTKIIDAMTPDRVKQADNAVERAERIAREAERLARLHKTPHPT